MEPSAEYLRSLFLPMDTPARVASVVGLAFGLLVLRYFLGVGLARLLARGRGLTASRRQLRSELLWSIAASAALAGLVAAGVQAYESGWTLLYFEVAERGWGYLAASFGIVLLVHETYYYWVHRLLHLDLFYRLLHRHHHQFVTPGPWAAFSFHPLEAAVSHAVLPALLLLIPLHPAVICAYLLWMAVSGAVNHLGAELYPSVADGRSWASRFARAAVGRTFIGATHHSQHHRLYRYNYGLALTLWDRVAGTQHPEFDADFDAASRGPVSGPTPDVQTSPSQIAASASMSE
ncbi:MAG: sterol desaturase family protein [Bdellovibrionales bacterium]|nr:sterol desaturase family protein [Bdellovibrionales bacterium]